jgi:hypothetical protein
MQTILVRSTLAPILALGLLFSGTQAFSAVLSTQAGAKVIEGVTVDSSAVLTLPAGTLNLAIVGAGLRAKSVPILGAVKVYVGEFLVSDAANFDRSAPLASIDKMQSVAAVFTFKRGLNIDQITGAFDDMFKANNIDSSSGPVADFLAMVSTIEGVSSGDKMAIIGVHNKNGTESIFFQSPDGTVKQVSGQAGYVREVFNFWFGQVNNDKGLVQFQKSVLSGSAL